MKPIQILLEAVKKSRAKPPKAPKATWPETKNKNHGFFGVLYNYAYDQHGHEVATGHAQKNWDKAIKHIHNHMEKLGGTPEDTRNYLDSVHGRHLAHSLSDEGSVSKAINRSYKSQKHFHAALKNTIKHRDLF